MISAANFVPKVPVFARYFSSVSKFPIFENKGFINGQWVSSASGKDFDVYNPVNGDVVASVPSMETKDVQQAISSAANAFKSWRETTAKERSTLLRNWFNIIEAHKNELATILHMEAGKPLPESVVEVTYGNSFIEWFSEEARRCYGDIIPTTHPTKELMHIKQPIGVAALITPWNFPVAMITRKAGAALAAGCTCVVKPAEDTPLSALALAKCAQLAGIPDGVINVVTCDRSHASEIGQILCQSDDIAAVTFTGSTAVGKLLYQHCAKGVKRLSLELGGNAPFIVFQSADITKAVEGAIASKFRNCGQTCVSANRFIIHESIFDKFIDEFSKAVQTKLHLGPIGSKSDKAELGPLINKSQLMKVDSIVKDALEKGAKVHCGGKIANNIGELYFEPTILSQITPNMRCYSEEVFGPVAVCIKFSDEQEAISIANQTESGLAGYFFSQNISQVMRVAKKLEVGMVGVNEGMISTAEGAFGGVKQSGIGREGSHFGLDEFLNIKYICIGSL